MTISGEVSNMTRHLKLVLPVLLIGGTQPSAYQVPPAPVADYHQHLFSPAIIELIGSPRGVRVIAARDLVQLLDSARIRHAVLLSTAYMFGSPTRTVDNEYQKVKADNDWTGEQAAM